MITRYLLLLTALICMLGTHPLAQSAKKQGSETVLFFESEQSTAYRAVFAQFLSVIPNDDDPSLSVDSAISVSNVCAAPSSLEPLIGTRSPVGGVSLFLYDKDGTLTTYSTKSSIVGDGLNSDGTLSPGQTWRVRLAEVIAAAWGESDQSKVVFSGYGWILSEFDCLAGTYSNTIFGLGFTQNFEMLPGMGQGGFIGGFPLPDPAP